MLLLIYMSIVLRVGFVGSEELLIKPFLAVVPAPRAHIGLSSGSGLVKSLLLWSSACSRGHLSRATSESRTQKSGTQFEQRT